MNKSLVLSVESVQIIESRRASFIAAIPDALKAREDNIADSLALKNASAHSKLGEIYRLADEIAEYAKPFIPCSKGCSSCCRMNVEISENKAIKIQRETVDRTEELGVPGFSVQSAHRVARLAAQRGKFQ